MAPRDFELARPLPDWWPHRFFQRCTPRLLIVTDGLSFGSADFGLKRFLDELAKYTPTPTVTTMTHSSAQRFDASATAANFDEIWLFGSSGPALDDSEVRILNAFMDAGGGVFATGDHLTLGQALCGDIPRVRKMRNWSTVPMSIERIDTVTNPGLDHITQFDDQSDDIPQRIFPKYYGSGSSWSPHALLRSPLGDIDVLPDHAHESECLVGTSLSDSYTLHGLNVVEFPSFNGAPLAPEIVAWSVSAGRYLNPPATISGKPPTTPKLFGAISSWDGHKVHQGRIVCDATWHHFININLDGTGATVAPNNSRSGLRDSNGNFTVDFHQVAQYYRNTLDWLIPTGRRWCSWFFDIVLERYRFPLFEEFEPLPDPHPCPWEPRVTLGTRIDEALVRSFGNGYTDEIAIAALEVAGLNELADELRPRPTDEKRSRDKEPTLLDLAMFRKGIVGSVVDALVRELPANPEHLEEHLASHGHDDDKIVAAVAVATKEAVETANQFYARATKRTLAALS